MSEARAKSAVVRMDTALQVKGPSSEPSYEAQGGVSNGPE